MLADYCHFNQETYQVAYVFKNQARYFNQLAGVIDDCRSDGLTEVQTVNRVADEMKDILGGELYEARLGMSGLVNALMPRMGNLDIDFKAVARYIIDSYSPGQRSNNRRPRTTSGKAPAKKPTNRRR